MAEMCLSTLRNVARHCQSQYNDLGDWQLDAAKQCAADDAPKIQDG
jgi:hypothetical protein